MERADTTPRRLRFVLHALMAVHTAIVALSIAAIGYVLYCGAFGASWQDRWLLAALAWPAAIGLGRYLNGVECILQTWAKRLRGQADGWARDMYLAPEAWALRIPATFTPLYLLGAGLVLGRLLERGGGA